VTIRPPSNVHEILKTQDIQVLASGVDSLYLSMQVEWEHTDIFDYLTSIKNKAREYNTDYQGILNSGHELFEWPFIIKPHGTNGYEWLLKGHDYTIKVGNWKDLRDRPSIMAEISSETLWHLGVEEAVSRLKDIISNSGGNLIEVKLSRADLCIDVLIPKELWSIHLIDYAVTRATDIAPYYKHRKLTGIRIGKGIISARLYDKPLEIAQQSKKYWMYAIWGIGIDEIPDDKMIIRIEFQLRREFLKQVKLNTIDDLISLHSNAWARCTQIWLRFEDGIGKHVSRRKTLPFWKAIQAGYEGAQRANPLVREKAYVQDKRRVMSQIIGHLSSLMAIELERTNADLNATVDLTSTLITYLNEIGHLEIDIDYELNKELRKKRARCHRASKGELEIIKVQGLKTVLQ